MELRRNIIFDLGGIIANLDYIKSLEDFNLAGKIVKNINIDTLKSSELFQNYEKGEISTDFFLTELSKFYENSVKKEDLASAWNSIVVDFPLHRIEFIKELQNRGEHTLFLLSNINDLHLQRVYDLFSILQLPYSFDSLFTTTYYSHLIGMRKPESNIFEHVLQQENLKAEDCLFVDDTLANVETARKLNIESLHIASLDEIMGILK